MNLWWLGLAWIALAALAVMFIAGATRGDDD